nr:MAG: RNA-dependent RNA polymerase [XiangYun partiti-picobirna-like virus 4]
MQRTFKRSEMDRPTFNSLEFVQRVKPHRIRREPWLVDPFVKECLEEMLDTTAVEAFGRYTRSYYTEEGHYANLWKYDSPYISRPNDPIFDRAIEIAAQKVALDPKPETHNWNNLASVPFIAGSSAGWGYIGKKGSPGNHALAISRANAYLLWWRDMRNGISQKEYLYHPDLAWTRTQLSDMESPKIRHVWGKTFENIILEGITAAPLIDAYRASDSPIVVGINTFRRLPLIIAKACSGSPNNPVPQYGIGIDFKSFDSSPQEWLINIAFDILEQNIIFTGEMEKLSFEYSKYYFTHTPVVMPDGRLWRKHQGIPSGSYFTQLIGSIVNLIITSYIQLKLYNRTFDTWVLGDDSLFGIPVDLGRPDLNAMARLVSPLGFTIHPDKCTVTRSPRELEFLGHCARGSRVEREDARLMRMVLYPEFPVTGPAMSMSRILGAMIGSAMNSWPILHLYDYMKARYRELLPADFAFAHDDKDWLVAVVGLPTHHPLLTPSDVFVIT